MFFNSLSLLFIQLRQFLALSGKRPEFTRNILTDDEYNTAIKYNRCKMAFVMFLNIVSHIKDMFFAKNLEMLYYTYVEKIYNPDVMFIILFSTINTILDVPLDLFFDFVIEEKFGFNKKSLFLFFKDLFISLGVSSAIIYPLASISFYLVRKYENFYIYIWILASAVIFFANILFQSVFAPLYNKFEPLKDEDLKEAIIRLNDKVGFKASEILVMDGSKRSGHSNAYFTGFGKVKKIVLYDSILTHLKDKEEILAVLCHELGHWHHNHTLYSFFLSSGFVFVFLYGFNYFIQTCDSNMPICLKFIFFNFLSSLLILPLNLIQNSIVRMFERQADSFAVKNGFGEKLKSALISFYKENKVSPINDSIYSTLMFSHPTVPERVDMINELEKKSK